MNRWISYTLLIILLVFNACNKPIDEAKGIGSIKVKTATVKKISFVKPIHSSGKVFSKTEVKLSFKTGGIIQQIFVREGEYVQKGQLLATLNLSEIQPQVDQANYAADKAQRDYARVKNLYADSVATLEQYQNVKTALDYAKANARIALFNLKHSDIKAPANGKILKKLNEANEIVGPGYPVFLFASSDGSWIVRTNITDKDIIKLKIDDSALVSFDAYPDKKFKAYTAEIASMADPYTGTYEVELALQESDYKLLSGLIATVDIFHSQSQELFAIPIDALLEMVDSKAIFMLVQDNKVLKTSVKIISFDDQYIYVKEGIHEGDEVIIEGSNYVEESSIVEIIN